MTTRHTHPGCLNRRDAMKLLGASAAGAGFGLAAGCGSDPSPDTEMAVEQTGAPSAPAVTFPEGAIIRTVLADVAPEVSGTGATLFHEHLARNFSSPPPEPRAPGTPAPTPPTNAEVVDLVVEEINMAGFDGVSCIVDSLTGPRTDQQLENLTAMATRSDVHVVLGGSYFLRPRYPEEIIRLSEEEITAHMVEQAGRERWGTLGVCAAGKITSSTSHQMAQNASESDGGSHRWAFLWHRSRTLSHHDVPESFCGADS